MCHMLACMIIYTTFIVNVEKSIHVCIKIVIERCVVLVCILCTKHMMQVEFAYSIGNIAKPCHHHHKQFMFQYAVILFAIDIP